MLGGGAVVGAIELGDVEGVFVTVDDQRHLGDVAFVDAVAGDAALGGPTAEVASEFFETVAELGGLAVGFFAKAAEGGTGASRKIGRGTRLNWPRRFIL
jgi:hypothetical protein